MVDGIKDRTMFSGFDRSAARSSSGPITVVRSSRASDHTVRAAFAIPRRVGPAVVRNRVRRQLRAALDELKAEKVLPDGAYLVVVRPGARGSHFNELRVWLSKAIQDLSTSVHGTGPASRI